MQSNRLTLHQNLLQSGNILLSALKGLSPSADAAATRLTLVTSPNLTLTLHEAVTLYGPFGLVRRDRSFSLVVDEPEALVRALHA